MKELNELVEQAKFVADWHGSDWSSALCQGKDGKQTHEIICESRGEAVISTGSNSNEASWLCDYLELCSPENILSIAEAFRALEREVKHQLNVTTLISKQHNRTVVERDDWKQRAEAAEEKLVNQDYFGSLVLKARISADKAMVKFPQPNYVLLKVAEEAGEVVQAGVHYAEGRMKWDQLEGEVVQLLAMLIRLVTEGDQVNGVIPPQKHE